MWFTINKYDHGCCGREYPSKLDAIKDGAWSPWTEERVRRAHNLGRGTMKDHEWHNKLNHKVVVSKEEFWRIAEPLGEEWRREAEEFIKDLLTELQSL